MLMINEQGEKVYYNPVTKRGKDRYIIKAVSGQIIRGGMDRS